MTDLSAPWTYEESPGEPNLGRIVTAGRKNWVAVIQHNGELTLAREKQHGAMFAAAPDLVAALQRALSVLPSMPCDEPTDDEAAAVAQAREALAAAGVQS